ncbi:MAG TPA: carbohydrate ABC transporter permease [Candidatus Limnocylindria bacterium]
MTTRASTNVTTDPIAVQAVAGTKGARRTVAGTVAFVILLAVAAAILVPIVYAVLGGFKDNGQLAANPVALIPDPWVFDNYADVLWGENAPAFWGELFNSVIVAIIAVGVTVGCASAAAFVFARIRFRGREAMFTLFVFGLLFPTAVAILPLYILIRQLGLSGSLLGVALPQAAFGLPLSIVILRVFFRSIPMELEDAARMDGCGSFGFFWRVLLPLSRPAIATVSVLAIVTTWNAFILPLVVLNSADQWTLPLGVMNFASTYSSDAARTLAFTVVSLIPALIFYLIAERHIVGGLTSGSVKG